MYILEGGKGCEKKKIWFLLMVIVLIAVISGCSQVNEPITKESTGIWNQYVVYPLSWLITYVANLAGANYGVAIIVVTLIIRSALLPLMIKQTRSTKAMQALQPEMTKLREKNIARRIKQRNKKLQQEMMQLYQKHGVNPIGGCLPIFLCKCQS
ncbi:hypothetical protein GCM10020331_019740 [Ectobacillus funiculus]